MNSLTDDAGSFGTHAGTRREPPDPSSHLDVLGDGPGELVLVARRDLALGNVCLSIERDHSNLWEEERQVRSEREKETNIGERRGRNWRRRGGTRDTERKRHTW